MACIMKILTLSFIFYFPSIVHTKCGDYAFIPGKYPDVNNINNFTVVFFYLITVSKSNNSLNMQMVLKEIGYRNYIRELQGSK